MTALQLDEIVELHALVRSWVGESLDRGQTPKDVSDLGAALGYVDLFFAFGFAKLGSPTLARARLDAARAAFAGGEPGEDRTLVAAFLLKAFAYRIEEAIAGRPHAGQLAPDLLGELDVFRKQAPRIVHNPCGMANYTIARMRQLSRILEPQERINPYAWVMRLRDILDQDIYDLPDI